MLPGDGASLEDERPLIDYLSSKGFAVQWIPLKESGPDCSYEELESDAYCKYIDSMIPKEFYSFTMYGISKGCNWVRVYAAKNPTRVKKLVMCEPTTMIPSLLRDFEIDRGNDFIDEMYTNPAKITREDNTKTALDVIVSDHRSYIPKCPTTIIWTSRNTQNEPYDNHVIHLKEKFVNYLRNKGARVKVINIDAPHYINVQRRYFGVILNALR